MKIILDRSDLIPASKDKSVFEMALDDFSINHACIYNSTDIWIADGVRSRFFKKDGKYVHNEASSPIKAMSEDERKQDICIHTWRYSDSSLYDLVCTKCGITDRG